MQELTVRDNGAFYNWTHETRALRESKAFKAASNGINETKSGSLECKLGGDRSIMDIIGNIFAAGVSNAFAVHSSPTKAYLAKLGRVLVGLHFLRGGSKTFSRRLLLDAPDEAEQSVEQHDA